MSSKNRKPLIATLIAGGAAALVVVGLAVPSGATFSDTDTARVDIKTASLSLGVGDEGANGTINLTYGNLKPGEVQHDRFRVTNEGTIDAIVTVGSNFTNSTPAAAVDYNQLKVGFSGITSLTPVTQLPASWNLGSLKAGETKWFTFDVALDQAAGNEWQGQTFAGNVPVTLTQQ